MSDYTYPIGLMIMGLLVFAFGMVAAKRERDARERGARPEGQLPLPLGASRPPRAQPPAPAE